MLTLVLFKLYWRKIINCVNTVADLGKWRQQLRFVDSWTPHQVWFSSVTSEHSSNKPAYTSYFDEFLLSLLVTHGQNAEKLFIQERLLCRVSSNFCEQFKQRPNFASNFKLNGTIRYPLPLSTNVHLCSYTFISVFIHLFVCLFALLFIYHQTYITYCDSAIQDTDNWRTSEA